MIAPPSPRPSPRPARVSATTPCCPLYTSRQRRRLEQSQHATARPDAHPTTPKPSTSWIPFGTDQASRSHSCHAQTVMADHSPPETQRSSTHAPRHNLNLSYNPIESGQDLAHSQPPMPTQPHPLHFEHAQHIYKARKVSDVRIGKGILDNRCKLLHLLFILQYQTRFYLLDFQ